MYNKRLELSPMAIKYDLVEIDQNTLNTRLTVGEKGELVLNLINKLDKDINNIYGLFINGIFKAKNEFKFENDILVIKEFYGINNRIIITNDYLDNEGIEFDPETMVMYDDILSEYKYNSPIVLLVGKKDSGNYLVSYKIVDNIINTEENQIVFEDDHPELNESVIAILVNGVLYKVLDSVDIINTKTLKFKYYFPSQDDDVRLIRIKNS